MESSAMTSAVKPTFKSRLRQAEVLFGTILTLPATEIAEIYVQAGFDWLFVDLEHGTLSLQDVQAILQVASPNVACLVRIPAMNEVWIKRVLDIGPTGIIIPLIKTEAEAREAIQMCRYPQEGTRSVGLARAQGYGMELQDYVSRANKEIVISIQIEHIDSVRNLERIIEVPGIDGLFIGPYDLAASMGKIGEVMDPEVQVAIRHIQKVASRNRLPLGIFSADAEGMLPYVQAGYTMLATGIDTMLIAQKARGIIETLGRQADSNS